jgi:hypothetical protein
VDVKCERQFPHRKEHPVGTHFPEEGKLYIFLKSKIVDNLVLLSVFWVTGNVGWSGNCGMNEGTCHLSGFGADGKFTFDW